MIIGRIITIITCCMRRKPGVAIVLENGVVGTRVRWAAGGGRPSRTSRRRTENRSGEAVDGIFDTPAGSGWCPAYVWTDRTLPPVDGERHLCVHSCRGRMIYQQPYAYIILCSCNRYIYIHTEIARERETAVRKIERKRVRERFIVMETARVNDILCIWREGVREEEGDFKLEKKKNFS